MTAASDKRREKFFALMARFNQLGRLLPDPDEFDPDDAAALAEAKVILLEMAKAQHQMDAIFGKQQRRT